MHRYPEKVLQFGTGILLRGLPDYYFQKANDAGLFGGSIVVVKSTEGEIAEFVKSGNVFTTCIRGIADGRPVEQDLINNSISRVLPANQRWPEVLAAGSNPDLKIILSNTTEVGFQFVSEPLNAGTPSSFPAKLTAVLFKRFEKLGDQAERIVVVPTELIVDNGKVLSELVLKVAAHNNLGSSFTSWLLKKVIFCNSLVDRIVTKPSARVRKDKDYGALAIQAEPYKLWAIEGGEEVKKIIGFSSEKNGMIIAEDISYYRERKLRLLNGCHTLSVCLGFLSGFDTVFQMMNDPGMGQFVQRLMHEEIRPSLVLGSDSENTTFADEVLDRFRNPYTEHLLLSITVQATAKMKMRNIASFFRFYDKFRKAPDLMAKGFAAFLLFLRPSGKRDGQYFGTRGNQEYRIVDESAEYFKTAWELGNIGPIENMVRRICADTALWEKDLTTIPGFVETVSGYLKGLLAASQTR